MADVAFWQGNTALAHGALLAGCNFFGGYPITPSNEIAEVMAEELPKIGLIQTCSRLLKKWLSKPAGESVETFSSHLL